MSLRSRGTLAARETGSRRGLGAGDIKVREPEGAPRLRGSSRPVWEGMNAFAKRWRLARLAQPGTYELVEVQTKRGINRALLFPKAILRAEFNADAPLREAMRIKRERLQAKRAAEQRQR